MLKPMDIHNMEFKRSLRGYNEEEVDDFLAKIVGHYETVYQENRKLQEEIERLQTELHKKVNQEQDVLELISLTKQTASEIKEITNKQVDNVLDEARAEAAVIVAEARAQAKQMLTEAEARLMQTRRAEELLRSRIRSTMETIWNMLEDADKGDNDETRVYRDIASTLDLDE
ncbi:MAG: DivIVA domain-containing protein [Firmicutes bacterium]|jgi:cell division initiation protein|nr:DivIVA domain-containing protein [Bacillota bacterium]